MKIYFLLAGTYTLVVTGTTITSGQNVSASSFTITANGA